MSTCEPTPPLPSLPLACLPFVCPWGVAAQPQDPSGLVSRGPDVAAEEKGVCTWLIMELSAGSGHAGNPWSLDPAPISSWGTVPREGAWICGEVATAPWRQLHGLRLGYLVDTLIVGLAVSAQGLERPSRASVTIQQETSGPRTTGQLGDDFSSPELRQLLLVTRPADKWSHWDAGVTRGKN